MSLGPYNLRMLKSAFETLESSGCTSRRILSLGYPDILAPRKALVPIFGEDVIAKVGRREDSLEILRWHNMASGDEVPDARDLFAALGFELDVVDLVEARGGEILHDLNLPFPESLHAQYAAVIDAGTLEHCFNIGQAAVNVASAVAVGGIAMHGNPLNMFNHGFYNLNPTWYHDFYDANGFDIESLKLVHGPLHAEQPHPLPPHERFGVTVTGAVIVVIARRRELLPPSWPVQKKYRVNPTLGT